MYHFTRAITNLAIVHTTLIIQYVEVRSPFQNDLRPASDSCDDIG